jgi:SAM-dependent methyltransferase
VTTDAHLRATQAASFGAAADVYERARPSYPEDALDWVLPYGARDVLDLGAGTGKLTRLLLARGLNVTAVEPSDGMRAELSRVLPGVLALAGSAEAIPLPDASVDAVVVAQAWHWVDPSKAAPEVARVLRPDGWLGLIWNSRDASVGWVERFGELLSGGVETMDSRNPVVGPPFGEIQRKDFEWANTLTPDGLVDLAASRSYIISRTEDERVAILDRVREFTRTDPDLAGRTEFQMPYVTLCSRARVELS